jgi:hypothetical protein
MFQVLTSADTDFKDYRKAFLWPYQVLKSPMSGAHDAPDTILSIVEITIEGCMRAFPFFPTVIVTHRSLQSNFEDELGEPSLPLSQLRTESSA